MSDYSVSGFVAVIAVAVGLVGWYFYPLIGSIIMAVILVIVAVSMWDKKSPVISLVFVGLASFLVIITVAFPTWIQDMVFFFIQLIMTTPAV